jgi:hypothetical protein
MPSAHQTVRIEAPDCTRVDPTILLDRGFGPRAGVRVTAGYGCHLGYSTPRSGRRHVELAQLRER